MASVSGILLYNVAFLLVCFVTVRCQQNTGMQGCTYSWTPSYNRNAPGLTQQGVANSYTEDSCQSACTASPTCLSIDWNNQDKTCFFGTTPNPPTVPNTPVNHYDLVRNCAGGCSNTWIPYPGSNAPGLTQQGVANSYTEASCQSTCIATPSCQSIDWNNQDKTCFFGTTPNPPTVPNQPVNHYNLYRNCGSG